MSFPARSFWRIDREIYCLPPDSRPAALADNRQGHQYGSSPTRRIPGEEAARQVPSTGVGEGGARPRPALFSGSRRRRRCLLRVFLPAAKEMRGIGGPGGMSLAARPAAAATGPSPRVREGSGGGPVFGSAGLAIPILNRQDSTGGSVVRVGAAAPGTAAGRAPRLSARPTGPVSLYRATVTETFARDIIRTRARLVSEGERDDSRGPGASRLPGFIGAPRAARLRWSSRQGNRPRPNRIRNGAEMGDYCLQYAYSDDPPAWDHRQ
jgi:hypothetical protein